MAKRFTDTTKWGDDWFLGLSPGQKLFWCFLCDNCDHAGVWRVSKRAAEMLLNMKVDLEKFLISAGPRIQILQGGEYWYLTKFCSFQYGKMNRENKAHLGALKILESRGLQPELIPIASPIHTSLDKDKDKDKGTGEGLFKDFWKVCTRKKAPHSAERAFNKLNEEQQKMAIKAWPNHVAMWEDEGRKKEFFPYPASWLNSGEWAEEIGDHRKEKSMTGPELCEKNGHPGYTHKRWEGEISIESCWRCGCEKKIK